MPSNRAPIGILSTDTVFEYVETADDFRVYAEDSHETQWIQSDTIVTVQS